MTGYALSDRFDGPRDVRPRYRVLGLAQPGGEAHHERRSGHEDPVTDVNRRRVDANQNLMIADDRLVDVARLEHVD